MGGGRIRGCSSWAGYWRSLLYLVVHSFRMGQGGHEGVILHRMIRDYLIYLTYKI